MFLFIIFRYDYYSTIVLRLYRINLIFSKIVFYISPIIDILEKNKVNSPYGELTDPQTGKARYSFLDTDVTQLRVGH